MTNIFSLATFRKTGFLNWLTMVESQLLDNPVEILMDSLEIEESG